MLIAFLFAVMGWSAAITSSMPVSVTDYYRQTALPATGLATYYAPGIFELVYHYRLAQGEVTPCPECLGFVAMKRVGDLNRKIWIKHKGRWWGPWLVIDVAAWQHWPLLTARDWLIDLNYDLGMALGMRGPITVTVSARPPPQRPWEEQEACLR